VTPTEALAVQRVRAWLGDGWDDVPDQQLLDTFAGQRAVLAVQLDQLKAELRANVVRLVHGLLSWRGPWRW
jgi:hypothetical protein